MKKVKIMMWSVLCGLASTVFAVQGGEVELRIVHTNDTHSCVMPVNPNSSDTALADKGAVRHWCAICVQKTRTCCFLTAVTFHKVLLITICIKGMWK